MKNEGKVVCKKGHVLSFPGQAGASVELRPNDWRGTGLRVVEVRRHYGGPPTPLDDDGEQCWKSTDSLPLERNAGRMRVWLHRVESLELGLGNSILPVLLAAGT